MFDLYDNPKYYLIAFSYRDIPKEVDVFEECIRRFAKTPVERMLELCCGPAQLYVIDMNKLTNMGNME